MQLALQIWLPMAIGIAREPCSAMASDIAGSLDLAVHGRPRRSSPDAVGSPDLAAAHKNISFSFCYTPFYFLFFLIFVSILVMRHYFFWEKATKNPELCPK